MPVSNSENEDDQCWEGLELLLPNDKNRDDVPATRENPSGLMCHLPTLRLCLRECEETHNHDQEAPGGPVTARLRSNRLFRVVDVHTRSVIEMQSPCRYIALSYVWGKVVREAYASHINANGGKSAEPSQYRAGVPIWKTLPKTYEDAMTLVEALGERYVWIDALCTRQDDKAELGAILGQMDAVYAGALLTIMAVAGDDANAGLPGVTQKRREPRLFFRLPGADLYFLSALKDSNWSHRAWTYQEELLAGRRFYFTSGEVYYQCHSHDSSYQWREGDMFELPPRPSMLITLPSRRENNYQTAQFLSLLPQDHPNQSELSHFEQYCEVVETYSSRSLTFPLDRLNAFAGILTRFHRTHKPDFLGLRHHDLLLGFFDKCLLWALRSQEGVRVPGQPSWCWTSTTGAVNFTAGREVGDIMESFLSFGAEDEHNILGTPFRHPNYNSISHDSQEPDHVPDLSGDTYDISRCRTMTLHLWTIMWPCEAKKVKHSQMKVGMVNDPHIRNVWIYNIRVKFSDEYVESTVNLSSSVDDMALTGGNYALAAVSYSRFKGDRYLFAILINRYRNGYAERVRLVSVNIDEDKRFSSSLNWEYIKIK